METSWNESQFEAMSWHDNHVHGLRIREGAHGCGELELDLDDILEWLGPTEPSFCLVGGAGHADVSGRVRSANRD
jgi:hypothetical protein